MIVTPLDEILGENADNLSKLKMAEVKEYLENENDKKIYTSAMESLLSVGKPKKRLGIVYGLDPIEF
jgi:hypothetical protein